MEPQNLETQVSKVDNTEKNKEIYFDLRQADVLNQARLQPLCVGSGAYGDDN